MSKDFNEFDIMPKGNKMPEGDLKDAVAKGFGDGTTQTPSQINEVKKTNAFDVLGKKNFFQGNGE